MVPYCHLLTNSAPPTLNHREEQRQTERKETYKPLLWWNTQNVCNFGWKLCTMFRIKLNLKRKKVFQEFKAELLWSFPTWYFYSWLCWVSLHDSCFKVLIHCGKQAVSVPLPLRPLSLKANSRFWTEAFRAVWILRFGLTITCTYAHLIWNIWPCILWANTALMFEFHLILNLELNESNAFMSLFLDMKTLTWHQWFRLSCRVYPFHLEWQQPLQAQRLNTLS